MKKFFYSLFVSLFLVSSLIADITSDLVGYTELKCTIKLAPERRMYKHHEELEKLETPMSEIEELDPSKPQARPHMPVKEGLSTNWSGYVSATNLSDPTPGSVSGANGYWVVPRLNPTPDNTYSSFWVGIDGYTSNTVEQIGTEHDWSNGMQTNYAWFEMYPNPAYMINEFPINVGDLMQGEVAYIGNNQFFLALVNHTRAVYTIVPYVYANVIPFVAQRSSAEWIAEAPSTNFGNLPLANFGAMAFMNCTTIINNNAGGILGPGWTADPVFMVTQNNPNLFRAIPTGLQTNESFYIVWAHE